MMFGFDVEKGGREPNIMPRALAPAATGPKEFLPAYEDAVNTNLRNFKQVEGYEERKVYESKIRKRHPTWKRCLIFGLPLTLFVIVVVGISTGMVVFQHEKHSAESSNSSSTTNTKRQTITIIETYTVSPSIPSAIAQAASSFLEAWSSSIASETSTDSAHPISTPTTVVPLPSVDMSPSPATVTPLPSTNMSPASSALPPPTTSIATTSYTPIATADPLGEGFCGLPGMFCGNGKRMVEHANRSGGRDSDLVKVGKKDIEEGNGEQASTALITVTEYLNITTTSTTLTTPAIPASIIAAAEAYYQQWSSSFFTTVTTHVDDTTSSSISMNTPSPPPITITITPKQSLSTAAGAASESIPTGSCVSAARMVEECRVDGNGPP